MAFSSRHGFVGLVMIVAALLSLVLTPRQMAADSGTKLDLAAVIPTEFGEWKELPGVMLPISADPRLLETESKIYNQVLMRTYENHGGDRVMLAIAYGRDQSDDMQLHKPEVCYAFQGFQILHKGLSTIEVGDKRLPVKRLVAIQGDRIEPISYWIKVGDEVVQGGLQQKLAQLRYGLAGTVPDGMLVRVSTIQPEPEAAYILHSSFIKQLYNAMSAQNQGILVGRGVSVDG